MISETKKIYLTPKGATVCDSLYSTLSYNIPKLFPNDKYTLYNTIRILHAEIPYSFYLINSNNNTLALSTGNITLTNGNYNANTFMTMVQPLLPSGMVITLNKTVGIFTFTHTTSFTINANTTCYKLIGCAQNIVYGSVANAITLPFIANFLGTKNIYINTPSIVLDNFNSATKTYTTLLCVQANVPPYGIIFYDNRTSNKNTIKGINGDSLDIQIWDDDFKPINFNNTEWAITLEIETVSQFTASNNTTLNIN